MSPNDRYAIHTIFGLNPIVHLITVLPKHTDIGQKAAENAPVILRYNESHHQP